MLLSACRCIYSNSRTPVFSFWFAVGPKRRREVPFRHLFLSPARFSSESDSSSLDSFLDNIHLKHKIRSDRAIKAVVQRKETEKLRARRRESNRSLIQEQFAEKYGTNETSKKHASSTPERGRLTDINEVHEKLRDSHALGMELPVNYLVASSAFAASEGRSDMVELCQKIMEEHHEREFQQNLRLDHYYANALWKTGNHSEAVKLLKELFFDYPGHRRKLGNIFRFCVTAGLNDYPHGIEHLLEFAQYSAKLRDLAPAKHLWQGLFMHESPAAHSEASEILALYPELRKDVLSKFLTFLTAAREKENTSLLLRMLQLIKYVDATPLDIAHYTNCVFEALMDIYCKNQDLQGAQRVFQLASEDAAARNSSVLPEIAQKLYVLMAATRTKIPDEITKAQYGSATPKMRF